LLIFSIVGNLVMLFLVIIMTAAAGGGRGEGPASRVREETIHDGRREKIAVVPVSGDVDDTMAENMLCFCEYVKKDPDIRGVVLEVDSPGGGITASDEIHHLVLNLKDSGRRVVVSMRSLDASGGYYISAAADRIYAEPTTLTGSIGVIWPAFEITGLMDKVGVKTEFVKSDSSSDYKDAGSPFKPFTEKDRAYIRDLVNNAQTKFTEVVASGRAGKLTKPAKELAIGKIWSADEALALGIIDEIAYLDDVCDKTAADLGLTNPTIIRLERKTGFFESVFAASPLAHPRVEVHVDAAALRDSLAAPHIEYRAPDLH
jgi:protease-4